jgi:citronellol/citronellal dehydrogenase
MLADKENAIFSEENVLLTKAYLPHLRKSPNGHVVTIAPPLNLNPHWLGAHPAYTLS